MQFGKARAETGQSFVLAVEEPELHIQPSQQKRLVNRLNALCNQTIVTTHSPIVAAMFPAPDTLFIETREGVLNAKPLMDTVPAQPTNHQQHLALCLAAEAGGRADARMRPDPRRGFRCGVA